jgi:hypothetical protein
VFVDLKKKQKTNPQTRTETSHQRRRERIERHKKLTLQQYDNNTKNLFISNIKELTETVRNKNKEKEQEKEEEADTTEEEEEDEEEESEVKEAMNKLSAASWTSSSGSSEKSTCRATIECGSHGDEDEREAVATLEFGHEEPPTNAAAKDADEEVRVSSETFTYEYVGVKPAVSDEEEYVSECFEQTYSIVEAMVGGSHGNRGEGRVLAPIEECGTRSASSLSGLSSVGSGSSSSLSNNGTSSSSISAGSVSPRPGGCGRQMGGPSSLQAELCYPSARLGEGVGGGVGEGRDASARVGVLARQREGSFGVAGMCFFGTCFCCGLWSARRMLLELDAFMRMLLLLLSPLVFCLFNNNALANTSRLSH